MPEEWELGEPLIRPAKPGGNRRRVNVREVMNGILYVLSTGCSYRLLSLVRKIILLAISRHQGKRLQWGKLNLGWRALEPRGRLEGQ